MKLVKLLVLGLGLSSLVVISTNAYLSTNARSRDNVFSTGTWQNPETTKIVINEVYYNVSSQKGSDGDSANPDEWLELYNAGTETVNLQNWTISDNTLSRTIHGANHRLAPGQFALIAKDHSTWSLYWTVAQNVEIIELGQKIGDGLSNTGDRLILRDDQGNIIDELSFGNDNSILNPAIGGVSVGHSIERNPLGFDNNLATDFIDQASPTPGS